MELTNPIYNCITPFCLLPVTENNVGIYPFNISTLKGENSIFNSENSASIVNK